MPQVIQNPKRLVDEFKKSGEFDRLRRQLLTHFANSDEVRPLMSRVEEIAREKLSSDERLEHKPRETVHSEVMQDMERYPIVDRAVSNLAVFKDEALLASIEQYVRNIVRGESNDNTKLWNAQPSRRKGEERDGEDNDESSEYSEDEEPGEDETLTTVETEQKENPTISTREPNVESSSDRPADACALPQDEVKASLSVKTPPNPDACPPLLPPEHEDNVNPAPSRTTSSLHDPPGSSSTTEEPSKEIPAGNLPVSAVPSDHSLPDGPPEQQAEAKQDQNNQDIQEAFDVPVQNTTSPLVEAVVELKSPTLHTSDQVADSLQNGVDTQRNDSNSPSDKAQAATTMNREEDHARSFPQHTPT